MFSKQFWFDFLEGIKVFLLLHTPFGNKNSIRVQLDEMYTDSDKLITATVKHLRDKDRNCKFSGEYLGSYPILIVDGNKYVLVLTTLGVKQPVQRIILKEYNSIK